MLSAASNSICALRTFWVCSPYTRWDTAACAGEDMTTRVSILLLLALGVTAALVLGCGSASTEQVAGSTSAPSASQPVAVVESQPQAEIVEVGYEVGLRAPEFGMSLLDGSRVTSSGLAEEGTPVFLYFHATY